ncbi:hypothetical protein Hanom_Chr08g00711921 [Helianthus anomalus]
MCSNYITGTKFGIREGWFSCEQERVDFKRAASADVSSQCKSCISRDQHGPVRYQTGTGKWEKWVPVPVPNIPVRYGTGTYRCFTRKYRYRTTEKVVTGTEYTQYCSIPVPGPKCPSLCRGNVSL